MALAPQLNAVNQCEYRRILPDNLNPQPLYLRTETFMPFLSLLMLFDPLRYLRDVIGFTQIQVFPNSLVSSRSLYLASCDRLQMCDLAFKSILVSHTYKL